MLLFFLTDLALALWPGQVHAQPYYFKHYQVENGLSDNTVFCSTQDKNGFIWFGTKEGLNRFDGYQFKLFRLESDNNQSLSSALVNSLFSDRKGTLWIGARRGLYRYDEAKEHLDLFFDSLSDVSSIKQDSSGNLWFLSRNTIHRYNFLTKKLTVFPQNSYFAVTDICLSDEGNIWVAAADGSVNRYNPRTETFSRFSIFSHSPVPSSYLIQKIYPAGKGLLFVGTTTQGIKEFDTGTGNYRDLLTFNSDKTSIFVRDIIQYSANEYWFATESGIFILNTGSQQFTNLHKRSLDPYSLSDNAVYSLCRDWEGGVWAGTYFGGVNYHPKQYTFFQKYYPDNSKNALSGNAVREICEDQYHHIWIGTEDAGLNRLDPETETMTHFKPTGAKTSIAYSNIHGLLAIGNDLWTGTFEHGLDILDLRTGKVRKHFTAGSGPHDFRSNFILCILQTRSADILLGTGNGLFRYNKLKDNFDKLEGLSDTIFVSALMEDHNKTIWAGTHDAGVFYYNPVTKQKGHIQYSPGTRNSITSNTINAICEDSNKNIWFSTEGGGLCILDSGRKQFSFYNTRNGLPSNYVFKVIEDSKKSYWISTSKGLVDLNPGGSSATVFTKANGLLNDQFNYNSGFKDSRGRLYFGSVRGMVAFRPFFFSQNLFVPPIYITGLQVQNKDLIINKDSSPLMQSIIQTDKLTLPHNKSSISLDFAALSYTSPEKTEYAYIMDGLDNEWTYLHSNRKVYFTNLAPGNYSFRLKAAVNNNWSKNERTLRIQILPPVWATPWAYLLYTVLALAVIYLIVSIYHKRTQIKKEKEIYEAKLNFFTQVAHEIKTPLTLIKGPLEFLIEKTAEVPEITEDVNSIGRNTDRLLALVTQILDLRQTETRGFGLDFAKVNIPSLLTDTYSIFSPLVKKKNLEFIMELPGPELVVLADEEALTKIFSNLFSNAVKYAAHQINVRLQQVKRDDLFFTVEISNDGDRIPEEMKEKIFEPFFRLKQTIRPKGTGIGLALARSLTELHNGILYFETDQSGLNRFVLSLPLKPEFKATAKLIRGNRS